MPVVRFMPCRANPIFAAWSFAILLIATDDATLLVHGDERLLSIPHNIRDSAQREVHHKHHNMARHEFTTELPTDSANASSATEVLASWKQADGTAFNGSSNAPFPTLAPARPWSRGDHCMNRNDVETETFVVMIGAHEQENKNIAMIAEVATVCVIDSFFVVSDTVHAFS